MAVCKRHTPPHLSPGQTKSQPVPSLALLLFFFLGILLSLPSASFTFLETHLFTENVSRTSTFRGRARWSPGYCARHRSERSSFEPWPGTLCCVLGQALHSEQCLSPPRCIKCTSELNAGGYPCDGPASHPGGSRNTTSHFMLLRPR